MLNVTKSALSRSFLFLFEFEGLTLSLLQLVSLNCLPSLDTELISGALVVI